MKALNSKQKSGLWFGIAIAVAMGAYPPWVAGAGGAAGSYAPIFMPPEAAPGASAFQIDFSRLLVQWAMVGFVVYGLIASGEEPAPPGNDSGSNTVAPLLTQPQTHAHDKLYTSAAGSTQQQTAKLTRLKFPDGSSLGKLLAESVDDPEYWDLIGEARGLVGIESGGRYQLELSKDRNVYLGSLGQPEMSCIVSLDASDSKITDDDLIWVAALRDLRELDLSNTAVTDGAMPHLSRLESLEKIWLDGTKVTDSGLSALKNMPKLKKVSVADTEVTDSAVITLRDQAKNCQFVLANGKNA